MFYIVDFSFEKSPRHDKYVPKFEAELSQFCEKLVGYKFTSLPPNPSSIFPVADCMICLYFSIMLLVLLQVTDLDRRVRRGRERLAQEVEPTPPPPLSVEKSEQLSVLEEKIKNLLEQVEALGEAGKVDEAEALMRKVLLVMPEVFLLCIQATTTSLLLDLLVLTNLSKEEKGGGGERTFPMAFPNYIILTSF